MKVKTHGQVVRMVNGTYVKNWQYSQGELTFENTNNIFHADNISEQEFEKFFSNYAGVKHLTVEFTAAIK